MDIEVEVPNTEIHTKDISVETKSPNTVVKQDTAELDITVNRREYSIIGDGLYIPTLYDDAPEWLQDLVDATVELSLTDNNSDLLGQMQDLINTLANATVPLNTFTQSILSLNTEDTRLNSVVETLNSNLSDGLSSANAQIIDVRQTFVSKEEASATIANAISAEIDNGVLSSMATVDDVSTAIADETSARAADYTALNAMIGDGLENESTARATAVQYLNTYVGLDENGGTTGTGALADITILQKQNDGVIETTTGTYDVMVGVENPNNDTDNDQLDITQEPYATWIAEDTRAAHIGDVYIKYTSATEGYKTYDRAYKFIKTVVDETSPYSTDAEGYTWALITDTDAQNAYVIALNAQDLADDKRRVFVADPVPPYDVGDLWLVQSNDNGIGITFGGREAQSGDILRAIEAKGTNATYENNDWVPADSYRESINNIQDDLDTWRTGEYSTFVNDINTQVDKKAESFYVESKPHPEGTNSTYSEWVGDLWKKPSDNTEYVYELVGGTYKWTETDVPDIVYDTIDTKKTIYTGNSMPSPTSPDTVEINDMWITGTNPAGDRDPKSIYVWTGSAWTIPVKYTDNQYAEDIVKGTNRIDLSEHIDSLGWNTRLTDTESAILRVDTDLAQKAIDISNLDNSISSEEATRIQAILDEEQARIEAISERIAEEAALDGKITTAEQNRIDAVNDVTTAYKEYNRIVALAMADGELTAAELATIDDALDEVEAAQLRLNNIESDISTIKTEVANINTSTSDNALNIANLDGKINTSEASLIASINNEELARIAAIQETVEANALLDGKIDDEESSRIAAIDAVSDAYKEYNRVVTLAIADGVLTDDEQTLIENASYEVDAAKQKFLDILSDANTYSDDILDDFLTVTYAQDKLDIGNQIDGKADTYFQSSKPYLSSNLTTDQKNNRDGDVWYDTSTSGSSVAAYRFSNTSTANDGWVKIVDTQILDALEAASKAQSTADGKVQNFTSTPTTPYYEGDTWMQGSTGDIYVCDIERLTGSFLSSDWVIASKYTNDDAVVLLKSGLADGSVPIDLTNAEVINGQSISEFVSEQIDNEVVVFSGTDVSTQTSMKTDDIYIESTTESGASGVAVDVVNTYKYTGTSWSKINNNDNLTGLADLADGKRTIYSNESSNMPSGELNDIWIPTTGSNDSVYIPGEVYQYNSGWQLATKYTEDLTAFVDEINPKVTTLKNQVDGKIEYLYYDNPMDNPIATISSGWGEGEHGNVVYYKDTDKGYWYNSSLDTFEQLTDTSMLKALQAAENAQSTVDGKINTYYAWYHYNNLTPSSNVYKFWLKTNGKMYHYESNNWVELDNSEELILGDGDLATVHKTLSDGTVDDYSYEYQNSTWVQLTTTGMVASSSAVTELEADLANTDATVGGHTTQLSTVDTRISNGIATVETKWAYDSIVNINGVYKKSGFGLTTNYTSGSGTEVDPYVSEFWIDASRLKFTNSNQTGQVAPFTIDASGTNPKITFNGEVSFSNTTDVPDFATNDDVANIEIGGLNLVDGTKNGSVNLNAGYTTAATYLGFNIIEGSFNKGSYLDICTFSAPTDKSYTHTLSFYAKADVDDSKVISYFYLPNTTTKAVSSEGNTTYGADGSIMYALSTEWKKYWITWTSSSLYTFKRVIPIRCMDSGVTYSLCGIKFETGNKATDWSPSNGDYLAEIESVDTKVSNAEIAIALADGRIDDEEEARINAINAEQTARATAIAERISAEAVLDGKITDNEALRISAANSLETSLKDYTDLVAEALIDDEISPAEARAIAAAQAKVDAAKAQLEATIDELSLAIDDINTTASLEAIKVANLDDKIDDKEAELINSINAEASARATAISLRIDAEAELDGKITANEALRISAATALETAMKDYTDVVAEALIDGEISDAESNAIAEAQVKIDAAKAVLQSNIDSLSTTVNAIDTRTTQAEIDIANADGKIDATEATLINSITAETSARVSAIADRVQAEALLDGKIDDEEAARIASAEALTTAYTNYTDTVRDALIDGEISDAEQNAIDEAEAKVTAAKVELKAYTDDEIAAIPTPDVTGQIQSSEDTFAQSLGFNSYDDMVNNAQLGKSLISGGYINTGLVKADSILANSVSADRLMAGSDSSTVWTGGGLVSQNFNGNASGDIGSPSVGFRLSSNAAGTSTDPNIYGAYIKGSTIEGAAFNIGDIKVNAESYPGNTGVISYTLVSGGGAFYGQNKGAGHHPQRVCSDTSQIVIRGQYSFDYKEQRSNTFIYAYLEYRIGTNDDDWVTLKSRTQHFDASGAASSDIEGASTIVLDDVIPGSVVDHNEFIFFRVRTERQSYSSGFSMSNQSATWIATLYNQ